MEALKNFDLHAMTKPKSAKDVLALLREFRAELARLQAHLDTVTEECEAEAVQA